ncbi:MAG: 4Fe-4S dicluster domain-containing protein [Bacteroidales bacterium]|nr:4Fe-4S dicluster domain-containing protein [Bacteroidales bacterium]
MKYLKTVRRILAVVMLCVMTLLFLDFTGTLHAYFGWMAKVQFLPAVLAINVVVIVALLCLTLLFGRVYCSVICPLGIMQDLISWLSARRKKYRFRFSFSPEKKWLRYGFLGLFLVLLIAGIGSLFTLLDPYASFGRMVSQFLRPIYVWGNNVLADMAERANSYTFYQKEVWIKSLPTLLVAIGSFVLVAVLAWRGGRTYCNTICPVGTLLGFFSRFSLFRPTIDTEKCNGCGLCSKGCKASCINSQEHQIDYSRCVTCFDCVNTCHQGAISYTWRRKKQNSEKPVDNGRRQMMAATAILATTATIEAQHKRVDGGLAVIEDKKVPERKTPIVPAGAQSLKHFSQHCVACQLCITACPNNVLRPSTQLSRMMQPEMSYEHGYCRPECTKCSEVCPAGAIVKIAKEVKASTQIGHAVWVAQNCLSARGEAQCNNCAHHCPSGAITMVPVNANDENSLLRPAIDTERCIGCGACENLCPSRPLSAIYVEGVERHRVI